MLILLLSILLANPFSHAQSSDFHVELTFKFSPHTQGHNSYRGPYIGHDTVSNMIAADTIAEAISRGSEMVGAIYKKNIIVYKCFPEKPRDPTRKQCLDSISDSKVLGANLFANGKYICSIGDAPNPLNFTKPSIPCDELKRSGNPDRRKDGPGESSAEQSPATS